MSDSDAHSPRLLPGAHLYRVEDGTWRHRDPDGRLLRIRGREISLGRLQRLLHGHSVPDSEHVDDRAIVAWEERGLLAPRLPLRDLSRKRVVLEGDTPISLLVSALLAPHVNVSIAPLDRRVVEESELVISCAGWLPDHHWEQVDTWCLAAGVPWHRCYVDGRHWVLGPLSWSGRTAGYADTRSRMLAAAAHADELQAYWNYLDSAGLLPPLPTTPAGTSAVVAGLLIAEVLAALSGEDMPNESNQVLVDIQTCRVERHPVLALPVVWALADRGAEGS